MSSQKLDIRKQAMELREEIEIPRLVLPTRPSPIFEAAPPRKAESAPGAVDIVAENSTKESNRLNREAVRTNDFNDMPPRQSQQPGERVLDSEEFETAVERVGRLSRDSVMMVPVNARVPKWLNDLLNETVHLTKSKGKKIKKEDIVTGALIVYLGIESEVK